MKGNMVNDYCIPDSAALHPGYACFYDQNAFHSLRADHAQFHFVAGNVVKKAQEKDSAAASALMENDYAQASRKVVQSLNALNQCLTGE